MLMTNHKKKGEKTKQEKLSKLLETPCANLPMGYIPLRAPT